MAKGTNGGWMDEAGSYSIASKYCWDCARVVEVEGGGGWWRRFMIILLRSLKGSLFPPFSEG